MYILYIYIERERETERTIDTDNLNHSKVKD